MDKIIDMFRPTGFEKTDLLCLVGGVKLKAVPTEVFIEEGVRSFYCLLESREKRCPDLFSLLGSILFTRVKMFDGLVQFQEKQVDVEFTVDATNDRLELSVAGIDTRPI